MHREDHFQHDKNGDLNEGLPRAGNEVHHASRGLQHQKGQHEMSQDTKRPSAAAAIDSQFCFNFRFENIQVLVDAARAHAPQFAIDQSQIGKNGQGKPHQHDTQRVEPA